ncbi:hypothetical protein FOCG_05565 [Fusarium oxysporum f. sp. radicis-lycopersici 26381]|uniref:Uncharacterized protein n=4 Tax=Fusarium oxysporum TaxID=5507 RepID=W9HR19_FUSOX|nr:hypothetical protein FOXG_21261 [Fusarium oxysporum f. sp. lycopersici 4287]EWY84765.1 hypothetical protein FOYG_12155 [Fusarium oxysporum NRRL 32931]EWZ35215.1 hypothetical protein FOZG_11231 [Fusarium oxysporum Fo47]EWZ96790.1 hypothetical protein FOWG_04056 [Fusarium oxysporum f. sp. lycopersici MN25]EXK34878.1 hypothetical protein FOMG_10206 [Fusarium oxysporum f. sp. melonis 26406]EXL54751.1 hypothetical protein FOCG_05565 [Fusarium oxysporum f. sp. radicis-lycopersici 26381]KAJ015214
MVTSKATNYRQAAQMPAAIQLHLGAYYQATMRYRFSPVRVSPQNYGLAPTKPQQATPLLSRTRKPAIIISPYVFVRQVLPVDPKCPCSLRTMTTSSLSIHQAWLCLPHPRRHARVLFKHTASPL